LVGWEGAADEHDAFVVGGLPVVVVDGEGEALFVVDAVDHQGTAVVGEFGDAGPEEVADACGDVADEDAGGDF
jgi:hypothetical protein